MKVNEIFLSIQGESLSAGFPTIFVRFTGCNLRCVFCDTTYAYSEGVDYTVEQVFSEIKKYAYKRVCLTGGEPLLQNETSSLLELLNEYKVTIETNGSIPLNSLNLYKGHSYVMDMKAPSSGCSHQMIFQNFNYLKETDEIKFVIGDRQDFEWAIKVIKDYYKQGIITISPIFGEIVYSDIVDWILQERLDVRFQLQLHKLIWEPNKRGV